MKSARGFKRGDTLSDLVILLLLFYLDILAHDILTWRFDSIES